MKLKLANRIAAIGIAAVLSFGLCNSANTTNGASKPYLISANASTSYKSTDYSTRNIGSACKLKGKQLIVNFFVDKTSVNLDSSIRSFKLPLSTKDFGNVKVGNDEIATELCDSNSNRYCIFKKNDLTCVHRYSWNATKKTKNNDSAITLNHHDFSSDTNQQRIPLSKVNEETTNFFGSYVSSQDISNRLRLVREAMNKLKAEAKNYNADFSYEMHPETNFQITYDDFDWSQHEAEYKNRKLGFNLTTGYSGGDGSINVTASNPEYKPIGEQSKFFGTILDESIRLTLKGNRRYAHEIDLKIRPQWSVMSDYTAYLKENYNVDGVIYLLHFNTPTGRSYSETLCSKYLDRYDEFAVLFSKENDDSMRRTIAHETAHLFGAIDYYDGKNNDFINYCDTYLSKDLMNSGDSYKISAETAFSIGWRDTIDTKAYNILFLNR